MLVYSKKNENGEVRLFGTAGNVPSSEDKELIYKDADGATVEIESGDVYLDVSSNKVQQVRRVRDDAVLSAYIQSSVVSDSGESSEVLVKVFGVDASEEETETEAATEEQSE